jgi:hypothetical protein
MQTIAIYAVLILIDTNFVICAAYNKKGMNLCRLLKIMV